MVGAFRVFWVWKRGRGGMVDGLMILEMRLKRD